MSHSNSSLNCFASCMAKYEHGYILHSPICKPESPHLKFGVMAHEVLYKAGVLRDEVADGVVDRDSYCSIIPSEVLYGDLKAEFGIKNWQSYFIPVVKQVAKYEEELKKEILELGNGNLQIEREIKLQLEPTVLESIGIYGIKEPLVGVIDLLLYDGTYAYILDYKFSSNKKTQDDFDMNSQLPIYAMLVHFNYDIPLHNIKYGYIDIPKQSLENPVVLKNGTLSRSKSQNVTQELYKKAVTAIHGEDPYYNCESGGYYEQIYNELALNKPAYLSIQYLDPEIYVNVTNDVLNAAKTVEMFKNNKLPFLKKYDAYTCKSCEYLEACKPYLTVGG